VREDAVDDCPRRGARLSVGQRHGAVQQSLHDGHVASEGCVVQRGFAFAVGRQRVGAFFQQHTNDFEATVLGGEGQRGISAAIWGVEDVDVAFSDQAMDALEARADVEDVFELGGDVQGRATTPKGGTEDYMGCGGKYLRVGGVNDNVGTKVDGERRGLVGREWNLCWWGTEGGTQQSVCAYLIYSLVIVCFYAFVEV
jgi:hypothetical protein